MATTIAAMSNPIGIAVGQLLPSALVSDSGGMRLLLVVSAIASTATMVLCFLTIRKEPLTPPSRSTAERRMAKERAHNARMEAPPVGFWQSHLIEELRVLLHNRQFWVLMFGVGIGLGLFNAVTTLIEQLVRPAGYDKDDAGLFGGLIIGCGLLGAAVVGPILDRTHAYNALLKTGLVAALGGTVVMLMCLKPGQVRKHTQTHTHTHSATTTQTSTGGPDTPSVEKKRRNWAGCWTHWLSLFSCFFSFDSMFACSVRCRCRCIRCARFGDAPTAARVHAMCRRVSLRYSAQRARFRVHRCAGCSLADLCCDVSVLLCFFSSVVDARILCLRMRRPA